MKGLQIIKFIGILFVILGIAAGIFIIAIGNSLDGSTVGFAILFMAIFCGIGGFFAYLGFKMDAVEKKILKTGDLYMGKILDYRSDRTILINGAPAVALVVRYMRRGMIREAVVNTGETDVSKYPLGATVSIRIADGQCALVPDSVSSVHLEREDDLLNPDFDPNANVPSVGVKCPSCGANLTVPYGMARICPYCETKVTVDENGKLPV